MLSSIQTLLRSAAGKAVHCALRDDRGKSKERLDKHVAMESHNT